MFLYQSFNSNGDTATNLSAHIQTLRSEVARLRQNLAISQQEHTQKMQRYAQEERNILILKLHINYLMKRVEDLTKFFG